MEFDSSNNPQKQLNEILNQNNSENSFQLDVDNRCSQLRIFIYGQKGV
jgi:hypothetical protein